MSAELILQTLVLAALGFVGWVVRSTHARVVDQGERIARIEGRLSVPVCKPGRLPGVDS